VPPGASQYLNHYSQRAQTIQQLIL